MEEFKKSALLLLLFLLLYFESIEKKVILQFKQN